MGRGGSVASTVHHLMSTCSVVLWVSVVPPCTPYEHVQSNPAHPCGVMLYTCGCGVTTGSHLSCVPWSLCRTPGWLHASLTPSLKPPIASLIETPSQRARRVQMP
eukprot:1315332-Rhodomonas_salina.3